MGEKDESKYAYGGMPPTGELYMQGSSDLHIDDLIGDISGKLVADSDLTLGQGVNDKEFKLTMHFNAESIKNTFSWKALFGSNNWRKHHGFRMRRKKKCG